MGLSTYGDFWVLEAIDKMVNGDMALQSVLPDSVNQRRRQVRQRLQGLREPIRSRREQLVPGPDVVGAAEERFANLRSQVTRRDSILQRIRQRREGEASGAPEGEGTAEQNSSEFQ